MGIRRKRGDKVRDFSETLIGPAIWPHQYFPQHDPIGLKRARSNAQMQLRRMATRLGISVMLLDQIERAQVIARDVLSPEQLEILQVDLNWTPPDDSPVEPE